MKNILGFAAACIFAGTVSAQDSSADLVLLNAKILTFDAGRPAAQALAVKGERILAVGTTQEIERLANAQTRRIDLGGRTVVPGFNDAHYHFSPPPPGQHLEFASLDPSWDAVKTALVSAAAKSRNDEWIFASVGHTVVLDSKIDRTELDRLVGAHPVLLHAYYGHGYIANSRALSRLGIGNEQADPAGGRFERVSGSQRINGRFWEYAQWVPARLLAMQASEESVLAELRRLETDALRFGITSMQVFSTLPVERFAQHLRKANLAIRVRAIPFSLTSAKGRDTAESSALARLKPSTSMVTFGGVKWVLDGTPFEWGAALRGGYEDRPGWRGIMNFASNEIDAMLGETIAANQQLLVHAVGDRTIAEVFDAMERHEIGASSWPSKRLRIEHGDGLVGDLVPRARRLGVVVVQNPTHFADAEVFHRRWGRDMQPLRSLIAGGVRIALGSDGAMNPFLNLMFASTHPANPGEALTREQALQAYTLGSAYAEFKEQEKGSIAPGKLADIAVLSQDPLDAPIPALVSLHSVLTIVGGRIVHEQN